MSDSHSPRYRAVVSDLRQVFPQPVSDRVHDAYLVFSFLRALDQLDAMKSVSPILGEPVQLDYEAAKSRRVADNPQSLEDVTSELVAHLAGMFIWGHPRSQINVVPPPTIASVIGGLLPSLYNPNLVSEESAKRVAVAEVEVSAMVAELVGYDPATSAGLFTFGGSGTLLYGAKLGLQKCCPNEGRQGRTQRAVLFCSQQSHYACLSVANWLGIGQDNVVQIPCGDDNQMHIDDLETAIRREVAAGARIAAIVATMGTTDHFGLDDLHAVVELRDRLVDELSLDYIPHVHADAVIGWAWSVFNDYDFNANPLEFRHRTVRALAGTHLERAPDSQDQHSREEERRRVEPVRGARAGPADEQASQHRPDRERDVLRRLEQAVRARQVVVVDEVRKSRIDGRAKQARGDTRR